MTDFSNRRAPWGQLVDPTLLIESGDSPEPREDYEDLHLKLGSTGSLETQQSRFIDCFIELDRSIDWHGSRSRYRNCTISIGRIGSLDLTGTAMNMTSIENSRIGFANLAGCEAQDVLFKNCTFEALDLTAAKFKRVWFENCTVEDLDLRDFEGNSVDFTGLDFAKVQGLQNLRNGTINETQLMQISSGLAMLAGIKVD